jgi:hypothetical protein
LTKINNDWVFNQAGALAYSLLMSIFPIAIAILSIFGFFLVIYIVVPNQHISVRTSWLGALGAAVALQLYLTLFPLYVAHFLNTYAGPISLVILLVFFYYFAIILLLGAEVNAFFLEKVTKTPTDPVTMMYLTTSQLPKSGPEKQEQAAQGYKDKPISDQAQKAGLVNVPAADNQDVRRIQARKPGGERTSAPSTSTQQGHLQQTQQDQHDRHDQHKHVHEKNGQAQTPTSKMAIVAEAVAGTGLAYLVELWRMRQKKP